MRQRLLIADGDRELSDVYRRFFSYQGYEVETADGGVECLAMLRTRPDSYVILDLEIPWGGGDGVLACLREEFDSESHPIVVVTSRPLFDKRLRPAGPERSHCPVVGYFEKPFRLSALLDCLRSATAS
jgi:two-component system response regulator MprA